MADISLEAVTGKLNSVGYDAFFKALRHAKSAGNRNVELAHWLLPYPAERTQRSQSHRRSLSSSIAGKLMSDVATVGQRFRKNETEMPGVSNTMIDLLDRGWHYATLFFGETQIRTGHILVGALKSMELGARFRQCLAGIRQDLGRSAYQRVPQDLGRFGGRKSAADGRVGPGRRRHARRRPARPKGTTALDRFSAGPHRQGQIRQDGPHPGPRRRNSASHRCADAPAAEQPHPHGRSRRRQNRGGRGLRAADRIRRRAAGAARRQAVRARRRTDAGRRLDEGRVRAEAAVGHRRGAAFADARSSCSSTKLIR